MLKQFLPQRIDRHVRSAYELCLFVKLVCALFAAACSGRIRGASPSVRAVLRRLRCICVGTLFFGVFCFVVPRYIVIRALSAIWQTSKSLVLLTSRGDNDIAGER